MERIGDNGLSSMIVLLDLHLKVQLKDQGHTCCFIRERMLREWNETVILHREYEGKFISCIMYQNLFK